MKKILRVGEKRKSKLESKGKQIGEGNDFDQYFIWPAVPLGIESGRPFPSEIDAFPILRN